MLEISIFQSRRCSRWPPPSCNTKHERFSMFCRRCSIYFCQRSGCPAWFFSSSIVVWGSQDTKPLNIPIKRSYTESNLVSQAARESSLLSLSRSLEAFGLSTAVQQWRSERSTILLKYFVFRIVSKSSNYIVSKNLLVILSHTVFIFEKSDYLSWFLTRRTIL